MNGENRIVAIASSTGGPKSLMAVIPKLPAELDAPVVIVQHMPPMFTEALAERMDAASALPVREAHNAALLKKGEVYLAKGGMHLEIRPAGGEHFIHLFDGPDREGVKPCANYMYESLAESAFSEVVCVVLTGMGEDGKEGIQYLKQHKKVFVISQNAATSIVYGMPKAVEDAGLSDRVVGLELVAREIITRVGVRE